MADQPALLDLPPQPRPDPRASKLANKVAELLADLGPVGSAKTLFAVIDKHQPGRHWLRKNRAAYAKWMGAR